MPFEGSAVALMSAMLASRVPCDATPVRRRVPPTPSVGPRCRSRPGHARCDGEGRDRLRARCMSANPKDWLAKAEGDFGSANWEMKAPSPNFDAVVLPRAAVHRENVEGHPRGCEHPVRPDARAQRACPSGQAGTSRLDVGPRRSRGDPAWRRPAAVPRLQRHAPDAQRAIEACTRLRASLQPYF